MPVGNGVDSSEEVRQPYLDPVSFIGSSIFMLRSCCAATILANSSAMHAPISGGSLMQLDRKTTIIAQHAAEMVSFSVVMAVPIPSISHVWIRP